MSEDRLSQECYLSFHNKYPQYRGLLFHVPNGGARDAREGAKFKSMGVFRGVCDYILLWNKKIYLIELKTEEGRQSKDQLYWQNLVEKHGFEYSIIKDSTQFIKYIESIILEADGE